MPNVIITKTAMSFRVPVTERGEIKNSPFSVADFVRRLQQWKKDPVSGQWKIAAEFFYFDKEQELLYLPHFALDDFKTLLKTYDIRFDIVDLPGEPGRPAIFHMLPHIEYKNDKQKNAVEYLTNEKSGRLRGLALQTGSGKSVSFIWALQILGVRSLITMTSRLEQWVSEFGKYTSVDESDIYIVQGIGSLTKLFTLIDTEVKPKVILMSTATMRLYLNYLPSYQHLPHPSQMCEKLGIGIVGTDEYHEHFMTNLLIGLMLNPELFIPITATFVANDEFVKTIFNQFIPKAVQMVGGAYDRFVDVYAYQYKTGGFYIKPFNYSSGHGYSQQKLEQFLLGKGKKMLDAMIEDAIIPIIKQHYINIAEKGEKFLFLCSSIKLCDYLAQVFKMRFPDKTTSVFYSGMPTTTLDKFDMILSTPGSAGTGRDIKGLRTCFVFENTNSEIRNLQFIGRLRGPPQMMNMPVFVYLSLTSIPQHIKYHQVRSLLYSSRAKSMTHRII